MFSILNKMNLNFNDIDWNTMIYIGRPAGDSQEHFGNPFSHIRKSKASVILETRDESVSAFRDWLTGKAYQNVEPKRREWILNNLDLLKNKHLICWCAPLACHGDVYLEILGKKGKTVMKSTDLCEEHWDMLKKEYAEYGIRPFSKCAFCENIATRRVDTNKEELEFMKIDRDCSCGCFTKIKRKSVTFGHGSFGKEIWVESDCGLRGKSFNTYNITVRKATEQAIDFWNKHVKIITDSETEVELIVDEFYWISIDNELTVGKYIGDSLFDAVGYEWNFALKTIIVHKHVKKPTL